MFDNDGTLWCEKPGYVQACSSSSGCASRPRRDPELAEQPGGPGAARAATSPARRQHGLDAIAARAARHRTPGVTTDEFAAAARRWLAGAGTRASACRSRDLRLRADARAAGRCCARTASASSSSPAAASSSSARSARSSTASRPTTWSARPCRSRFERRDGRVVLVRQAALLGSPNEGAAEGRCNIQAHIGRRPILAAGNSAGDREMLEYAHTGERPSLCLVDRPRRRGARVRLRRRVGDRTRTPSRSPTPPRALDGRWSACATTGAASSPTDGPTRRRGSPAPTFRMGSDAHYPEEAPAARSRSTASGSTATRSRTAQFAAFVAATRLRDRRRAPARPGRLPGRAGGEPRARLAGLHPHARAGRPAPPQPVVGVDAGRVLAAPGGPGLLAGRARGPPGRARRLRGRRAPTPRGRAARCRPRREWELRGPRRARRRRLHVGRRARAAGRAARQLLARRLPVAAPSPATARRRRSARSRPTATGCSTWPATSGSGRPTGTGRHPRRGSPAASRGSARRHRRQLDPAAAVRGPAQGRQRRLVPVRRQLLPALPARRPAAADDRHRHEPHRLPLRAQACP